MRLLFCILLISGFSLKAQKLAKFNLKDSCVISGGVMAVADFKKVCKVCPAGMKKVTSYSVAYLENHVEVFFPLKNGRWNSSFLKNAKKGTFIVIDDIKGIDDKGKQTTVQAITLGLN